MNIHSPFFRLAIRKDFSQEDFGRFLYFERIYHTLNFTRPNSKPFINYESVFTEDLELIAITYRDDGMVNLNWVQVTYLQPDHPDAKNAFDTIVNRLKEKVPTYTLDELLHTYRNTLPTDDGQRLFSVYATAVGAPWEYDQAVFDAMTEYAKDSKATVRAGVVIGIGYIGQTEYEPLLEQLAKDPSDDVAQRATHMLDSFQQLKQQMTT